MHVTALTVSAFIIIQQYCNTVVITAPLYLIVMELPDKDVTRSDVSRAKPDQDTGGRRGGGGGGVSALGRGGRDLRGRQQRLADCRFRAGRGSLRGKIKSTCVALRIGIVQRWDMGGALISVIPFLKHHAPSGTRFSPT